MCLCIVARGTSLFSSSFSVDDLFAWLGRYGFSITKDVAFRDGRFGWPFIDEILTDLGANASVAYTLSAFTLMVCQSVTALLICRLWKIDGDLLLSVVAISFLVLHPYQADLATWRIAEFPAGLPFVMVFWGLLICTRSRAAFGVAVATIVLALGIYQIPLEMAAAVLAVQVPLCLVRGNFDLKEWLKRIGALATGLVVYLVIGKLVTTFASHSVSIGRDKTILLSHPSLIIVRSREMLSMMVSRDPLTGWLARALLIALAVFCVARIVAAHTTVSKRIVLMCSFIISIVIAFLSAIALAILTQGYSPSFRSILSVGVIWAAIATIALALSRDNMKRIIIGAVVLILIGFVGSNNRVLVDQQRVNQRDLSMMNRIAGDIGALDNIKSINRILFVGTNAITLNGISTGADYSNGFRYGTTLSLFALPWPGYATELYNELTGARFGYEVTEEEQIWALDSCEGRRWPEKGSVMGRGSLAVVCLGTNARLELWHRALKGLPVKNEKGPFD
jgi:hypothetical protein